VGQSAHISAATSFTAELPAYTEYHPKKPKDLVPNRTLEPMQFRLYLCCAGLVLILGYRPATPHPLAIEFFHVVGDQPLEFSTKIYSNPYREPFSVEQYKYYISDIRVTGDDAIPQTIFKDTHLVDAADSSTCILHLTTSIDKLRSITFRVGVDSSANTAGVQTGDLDPMLGMFWTWNTGYVYARLQGLSDSARVPAHRFTWDVGGYRAASNALREITIQIQNPKNRNHITILADLLRWFDGRQPVYLSRSPVCHQPGSLAMQLADNYSTMFSVAH